MHSLLSWEPCYSYWSIGLGVKRLCTSKDCCIPEYFSKNKGTDQPHIITRTASFVEMAF